MSFKNLLIAGTTILLLAGCTGATPAAVVMPNTNVLKGAINYSAGGLNIDSYQFTNGSLTCSGVPSGTNFQVVCNDGRKGIIVTDKLGMHMDLNDGTKADIITGDAANAF